MFVLSAQVIPGIFVAMMLRMDVSTGFRSNYFQSAFLGYVLGLGSTIVVMNLFNAAQPALLYIVPAVLGCVFLHAAIRGDVEKVRGSPVCIPFARCAMLGVCHRLCTTAYPKFSP